MTIVLGAILFIGLLLTAPDFFSRFEKPSLEVDFLNVGQGDATLIKSPYGQRILIDGGPSSSAVLRELADNLPWFDRRIDLVILTHPHEDHLAGLLSVLKRYQVANIVYGSASSSSALGEAWLRESLVSGADLKKIGDEERIVLGDGCSLNIINPSLIYHSRDLNDYSLVARLDCGSRWLFTGDISAKVEKALLSSGFDLSADLLKVAHHGSAQGTSEEFLRAVDPSAAVVESGQGNSYNLPNPEIIRRLADFGLKLYRTDIGQTVRVRGDERGLILP